jgi:4-hydroxy-tetrahydrodipicolinate synthase
MNSLGIEGIITPLLTPFDESDAIDEEALRRLVRYQIDNGVAALFSMGSSAEFALLTDAERRRGSEIAVDEAAGEVPCLVGAIAEGPQRVLELAADAKAAGAYAAVVTAPYYFGWNAAEIEGFFRHMADHAPLPIVLYDIPWRTHNPIPRDTILRLSEHPNILGMKDTTTDGGRFVNLLLELEGRDDFALYQGSEPLGLPSFLLGADGAVFSLANVAPRTSADLYDACLRGDLAEARRLQHLYNRLFAIFSIVDGGSGSIAGALGGLKVALELLGIAPSRVHSPGRQASDEERRKVAELLRMIPETAERIHDG